MKVLLYLVLLKKLEECRVGNTRLNIAAETCRLQVAESNGWSAKMDMTDAMCRKIDELYNPSALVERVYSNL